MDDVLKCAKRTENSREFPDRSGHRLPSSSFASPHAFFHLTLLSPFRQTLSVSLSKPPLSLSLSSHFGGSLPLYETPIELALLGRYLRSMQ